MFEQETSAHSISRELVSQKNTRRKHCAHITTVVVYCAEWFLFQMRLNFLFNQSSFSIFSDITYKTSLPILQCAFRRAIRSSQSYGYTHTLSCKRTKPNVTISERILSRINRLDSRISKMTSRHLPSHFFFLRVFSFNLYFKR